MQQLQGDGASLPRLGVELLVNATEPATAAVTSKIETKAFFIVTPPSEIASIILRFPILA